MKLLRTLALPGIAAGLVLMLGWRGLSAFVPAAAEEFIYLGAGPVLGDRAHELRTTSTPDPGWLRPDWDDSRWDATRAVADGGAALQAPDGGTAACDGTLYVRRRFDVGTELSRLASLTLRLHYEDGFAAYINGREVARRRLPPPELTDARTLATERRPVEAESYHVPVTAGLLRQRDNLLAIEVHPRTAAGCPQVTAEISAADGPMAVRGPYIERIGEDAIDLAVESDVPTTIEVRYGKGPVRTAADRRTQDLLPSTMHRVRLGGLRAATTYHYQMALRLASGATSDLPEAAFHTPPPQGRPLRFVVYGDSRSGHATHAQVVRSILAEDPDLALNTGDVVDRGTEEGEWDRFFQVSAPLLRSVAVYLTPGNHEYSHHGLGALRLFDLFSTMFPPQEIIGVDGEGRTRTMLSEAAMVPRELLAAPPPLPPSSIVTEGERGYYSFDVAGVHFVTLDSNQYRSARQQRWLDEDLAQASQRATRAIFAWTHVGPYSSALHGDSTDAIRNYVPILERHGVTLLFSGHDHDYERGRRGRLSYIVTGGAGAELRPLKCGVPGKPPCKNPPLAFANEHHYVRVEVLPGAVVVCPKRIDGTPLEACQTSSLLR